jgi:hypothetical protein
MAGATGRVGGTASGRFPLSLPVRSVSICESRSRPCFLAFRRLPCSCPWEEGDNNKKYCFLTFAINQALGPDPCGLVEPCNAKRVLIMTWGKWRLPKAMRE